MEKEINRNKMLVNLSTRNSLYFEHVIFKECDEIGERQIGTLEIKSFLS